MIRNKNQILTNIKEQGVDPHGPAVYVLYYKDGTQYRGASQHIFNRLYYRSDNFNNLVRFKVSNVPDGETIFSLETKLNTKALRNPKFKNERGGHGGIKRPIRIVNHNANRVIITESLTEAALIVGLDRRTITNKCKSGNGKIKEYSFMYNDEYETIMSTMSIDK